MSALRRLKKEYKEIISSPPPGITARPINEKNLYEWEATIAGPSDTPYEGAIFDLKVVFPKNYPFAAPLITFITPIYHCNIDSSGHICISILAAAWSPV